MIENFLESTKQNDKEEIWNFCVLKSELPKELKKQIY